MSFFAALLNWIPSILLFILGLALLTFLCFCLYLHYIHTKYDHIPGPPRDSFLLGHAPTVQKTVNEEGLLHEVLLQWTKTYGPVYRINLLHSTYIITTCPEATKEILMNPKYLKEKLMHDKFFNLFGVRLLGNGMLTAIDHDAWYKQRRIMDPAFSSLYLRGLMGTFNERAEKLTSDLNEVADSESEAGMLHLFNHVTLDVIAKAAFGVDLELKRNQSPFPGAIETVLKGMIFNIRDVFFKYKLKNRPFINKVREACQLLRTTGAKWINDRKTAMKNGDDVPKDILTQIIKSAGKEEITAEEHDELMLDNFVTFFIAASFFGHAQMITRVLNSGGVLHDTLLQWAKTYGPVYKVHALHYVLICTSCPEATKEILMSLKHPKTKFLYKCLFDLFGERFVGNGLVTARDNEKWYKQRRVLDPAFSSLYLKGLIGTFNDGAEKLMSKLSKAAESQCEVSMLRLINCVTLDVIAKVAFGMELDPMKGDSPFPDAVATCLKGMVYNIRDAFIRFRPEKRPFIKKVQDSCHLLRVTGAKCIQERKAAMRRGDDVPNDILTKILEIEGQENTTKEHEELLVDIFVTFFIAGQETTTNLMGFCIMELGQHPEILQRAQKEVDDVIGSKCEVSYDDLGKLVYLSQVLKEVLRLYPTAPATIREVNDDFVINGIHIPGGFICIMDSYVAGRLDRFFKDPLIFDPDRFHPDAPKPYYCYYPFGLGPRACLGQNFSQIEVKVVMAKLLQRFDFTLTPGQTLDIQDTSTLKPKSGVMCQIKHRYGKI